MTISPVADALPGMMERTSPALRSTVRNLARDPWHFVGSALSLLKGRWYVLKYRLLGKRLTAGRNFRVYGSLDIRGPGAVVIGDDVLIFENVRAWSRARGARLVIGDRTHLAGTRFGLVRSISIGRNCKIGPAYLMDTNFHSTHVNRSDPRAPVRVGPVQVGDNVWISYGAGVLAGVTIGDDSVVSFGTVCHGAVPSGVIVAGNPARIVGTVPGAATVPPIIDMCFEEEA